MKRLINKILFGLTLTGGSLGLHSCGDWLDINSNELAATKTEAGYLFNYAAINYSSKRVGGDQWLPIIYAAQVASDADNWFVGDDMYNISTYATGNGWVTSYSSCGYNLLKAIEFATGENDSNSVAQCKILLANTVWESSMLYGDIPYSEAWNIEGTSSIRSSACWTRRWTGSTNRTANGSTSTTSTTPATWPNGAGWATRSN